MLREAQSLRGAGLPKAATVGRSRHTSPSEGDNLQGKARYKASPTLGRLWKQYLEVRSRLEEYTDHRHHEAEREARRLRDRLVVNYSPLVKYVVGVMPSRLRGSFEREDMMAWGVFGLLEAIESYDPSREVKFETYAISRIKWTILDELRKQDWVPRRVRTRAQEIEQTIAALSQTLGRVPTEAEIADETGLTLDEYRKFLKQYSRAQVSSLEARLEMNERVGSEFRAIVTDWTARDPQSGADETDLREQLVAAIDDLGEKERLVATFYFYEGLTLKEIGKALGLSEGRISQILSRALLKLRKSFARDHVLARV